MVRISPGFRTDETLEVAGEFAPNPAGFRSASDKQGHLNPAVRFRVLTNKRAVMRIE